MNIEPKREKEESAMIYVIEEEAKIKLELVSTWCAAKLTTELHEVIERTE